MHGLLAEVVIDAVDLVLVEGLLQGFVERAGGLQVASKGLFHHQMAPLSVVLCCQSGRVQLQGDVAEKPGRCSQIKQAVATSLVVFFQFIQQRRQTCVGVGLLKVAVEIVNALQ